MEKDTKEDIKEKILEIENRLNELEQENDILKIELANSMIEKIKLEEAKERLISMQNIQNEKYWDKVHEDQKMMEENIDYLRKRCLEVEKENRILLSERSNSLLNEVLKQAEKLMDKTGKNPFDI